MWEICLRLQPHRRVNQTQAAQFYHNLHWNSKGIPYRLLLWGFVLSATWWTQCSREDFTEILSSVSLPHHPSLTPPAPIFHPDETWEGRVGCFTFFGPLREQFHRMSCSPERAQTHLWRQLCGGSLPPPHFSFPLHGPSWHRFPDTLNPWHVAPYPLKFWKKRMRLGSLSHCHKDLAESTAEGEDFWSLMPILTLLKWKYEPTGVYNMHKTTFSGTVFKHIITAFASQIDLRLFCLIS